jgi:neuromedin U receptor 1
MKQFVPICVTYLLIFVVGTLGNGLTCTVILRNKTMRTPTNFYLFSLAVSDMLVLLVGLPLELYEMQQNYPFQLGASACYFRILLLETVCLASVLNVTALSVERYVAVVRPLQAKSVMTRAHVRRMVGAIWVLATLFSLPNTSLHGLSQLTVPCRGPVPDSAICSLVGPMDFYKLVVLTTALLFFCLPMVTISVLYLLIGLRLRRERMLLQVEVKGRKTAATQETSHRRIQLQDRGRRQVTKMLCKSLLRRKLSFLQSGEGIELPGYCLLACLLVVVIVLRKGFRAGEMAQQVRALTTLLEVMSSNPSNHMVTHNHP